MKINFLVLIFCFGAHPLNLENLQKKSVSLCHVSFSFGNWTHYTVSLDRLDGRPIPEQKQNYVRNNLLSAVWSRWFVVRMMYAGRIIHCDREMRICVGLTNHSKYGANCDGFRTFHAPWSYHIVSFSSTKNDIFILWNRFFQPRGWGAFGAEIHNDNRDQVEQEILSNLFQLFAWISYENRLTDPASMPKTTKFAQNEKRSEHWAWCCVAIPIMMDLNT